MTGNQSRSLPPAPGSIPHFDFPEVRRTRLPNGLSLHYCRAPRVPLVSVSLFVRCGEAGVKAEEAGLAVLTGSALDGGTTHRDGAELAEAFEGVGASLAVSVGWEGLSAGFSCLADRLTDALPLLAETVLQPAFPRREVERVRDQQLAAIRQRDQDPAGMASVEADHRFFARTVPYARPRSGNEESVSRLTRAQVEGFASSHFLPGASCLVAVGDLDGAELEELTTKCFGRWTGGAGSVPEFESLPASVERAIWVVNRPGSVQSELRVGHVGASASVPDRLPLGVANLVLGGMFSSRLNLALRERHGFTYGVRSRFTFRTRPGPFQVSTSVGTDVTAPAVREILRELDSFAQDGATDGEVRSARDYAVGAFGLRLETVGQVASLLTRAFIHGLPHDHYPRYRERMRRVTPAEVCAAGHRYLRPREAQVVVVGDADEVAGPLERLGLGPVEVIEPQ